MKGLLEDIHLALAMAQSGHDRTSWMVISFHWETALLGDDV